MKTQYQPVASGSDMEARILAAASDLFAARGFRSSTVRDIAAAARINEVTIYRYFPKKHDLCWRAVDWKLRNTHLKEMLLESLAGAEAPRACLQHLCISMLQLVQAEPSLGRLLYFTGLELEGGRALVYRLYLEPVLDALSARIQGWIKTGSLRAVDPESTAFSIVSILFSQFQALWIFPGIGSAHRKPLEVAEEYSSLLLDGLTPGVEKA
jgi:AcrR family transcriptional regulator